MRFLTSKLAWRLINPVLGDDCRKIQISNDIHNFKDQNSDDISNEDDN